MKTILIILLLAVSAHAQTSDNDALFGTFNLRDDSARIRLATNSEAIPVSFFTTTFNWTNGPLEEINYKNHTWATSFNTDFNGQKIVLGEVSYAYSNESKYRNGIAGLPGSFMSEHYFSWTSPDGLINIRPFGWNVQYDTGNTDFVFHGELRFFRHQSNGGGMWGFWHDDGYLDLTNAPQGVIGFKNNTVGLRWANATGTNSVAPMYVDNFNRVVIGGGQVDTWVNSANLIYTSTIKRGTTQILGARCSAIPNSVGNADDMRAINSLLQCLRNHGLLAP